MNNKGFMMAEVVVVASIVLVTMAGLYASYNKIFALYNQRIDYYDVATLYELGNYKKSTKLTNSTKNDPIEEKKGEKIYYIRKELLEKYKANDNDDILSVSPKLKDYLNYLSSSLDFKDASVVNFLIMERCMVSSDDCKYAYLEVFDEDITP